jgi:hypothetical protein
VPTEKDEIFETTLMEMFSKFKRVNSSFVENCFAILDKLTFEDLVAALREPNERGQTLLSKLVWSTAEGRLLYDVWEKIIAAMKKCMHPEYLMEVLAVRDNRENNFLRYSLSEEHALSNLVSCLLEDLPSNESRSALLTKRIQ